MSGSAPLTEGIRNIFKKGGAFRLFGWMFGVVALLNVGYALLRSARNALVVADIGHGAGQIPLIELLGTMPAAVLMVWCLTRLMNRWSMRTVFLFTLALFSSFFVVFSLFAYPLLASWSASGLGWISQGMSALFFVMAELWKVALLSVLFWGCVNQYVTVNEGKTLYAPLMLSSSLGTVLAGLVVQLCTSQGVSRGSWAGSLLWMMVFLAVIAMATAWCYNRLWRTLTHTRSKLEKGPEQKLSVITSLKACLRSPPLFLLAYLTTADYIAYALGEVVFLDLLKHKFPDPRAYCDYNGKLTLWNGLLTAVGALCVGPYLMRRFPWVVTSIVTPVVFFVTETAFFMALWMGSLDRSLDMMVMLGALFFCSVRAAKYALFDPSKEVAFLHLSPSERIEGKLIIDGLCSRLGRAGASLSSLCLNRLCGGVLASVIPAGILAMIISGSCLLSTVRLGVLVERRKATSV